MKNVLLKLLFAFVLLFTGITLQAQYVEKISAIQSPVNQVRILNDTLWVCAYDGLYRYDGNDKWKHFTTADGLPSNNVYDIGFDKVTKRKWVGTMTSTSSTGDYSLTTFNGDGNWVQPPLPSSTINGAQQSLHIANDSTGKVWVSFWYTMVAAFDGNGWASYPDGVVRTAQCSVIYVDKLNQKWIGTNSGLHRLDASGSTFTAISPYMGYVYNITTTPGSDSLLISTQNGLFKIEPRANTATKYMDVSNFCTGRPGCTIEILPGLQRFFTAAYDTNNILWIGNNNTLYYMGCTNRPEIAIDLLAPNSIVVDTNNAKWVGSANGLYRVTDQKASFDVSVASCAQYTFTPKCYFICDSAAVTWEIDFGDGTSTLLHPGQPIPAKTYPPGTYTILLTQTIATGEKSFFVKTITVNGIPAYNISGTGGLNPTHVKMCKGDSVTFTMHAPHAGKPYRYKWSFAVTAAGPFYTISTDSAVTFLEAGYYRANVNFQGFECENYKMIRVDTIAAPQTSLMASTQGPYCAGDTVNLSALHSNGLPVTWYNGQAALPITDTVIKVWRNGSYYFTVDGCKTTGSNRVTLAFDSTLMSAAIAPVPKFCPGDVVSLAVTGTGTGSSYFWNTGEITASVAVSMPGSYGVTVVNSAGCSQAINYKLDYVQCPPQPAAITIPNTITPNGDGFNDTFEIKNMPAGTRLVITNRWGSQVYQSDNYDNKWSAASVAPGTYYIQAIIPGHAIATGWLNIIK